MKKILFTLMALLILAMAACTAPAEKQETTEKTQETVKETTQESTQEQTTQKEPETGRTPPPPAGPLPSERQETAPPAVKVEQPKEMNPALRDLLKKADEKITSLSYLFGGSETGNLFLNTYFIKQDKMKIKLYEEDYYVREGYYDTIYINDAIGCCEELSRCKSHNIDNTGKAFEVDVSTLKIPKTPYQWIKEIPADAQILGPQTVNSRSVTQIKYKNPAGEEIVQWIDQTYGVPHKIEHMVGDTKIVYQFNDMKFNQLKDAEFDPVCD
jgi:hypothetical protein